MDRPRAGSRSRHMSFQNERLARGSDFFTGVGGDPDLIKGPSGRRKPAASDFRGFRRQRNAVAARLRIRGCCTQRQRGGISTRHRQQRPASAYSETGASCQLLRRPPGHHLHGGVAALRTKPLDSRADDLAGRMDRLVESVLAIARAARE